MNAFLEIELAKEEAINNSIMKDRDNLILIIMEIDKIEPNIDIPKWLASFVSWSKFYTLHTLKIKMFVLELFMY